MLTMLSGITQHLYVMQLDKLSVYFSKELVYKLATTQERITLARSQSKNWFEIKDAAINLTKHNNLKKSAHKHLLIKTQARNTGSINLQTLRCSHQSRTNKKTHR